MICNFCGRRLDDGSTFCTGCGAQLGNSNQNMNMNSNMNGFNQPNNNNNNVTYDYGNLNKDKFKKEKNSSTAIGLILALVIIIGLVVYAFWAINSKEKKNKDNTQENAENVEIIEIESSFNFLGYTFDVPKGFTANTETYQDRPFIQNSECLIMLTSYPSNYNTVLSSKDFFISQLEADGIKINSFTTKTINNKNYIIATGTLTASGIEYGYVLTDLDSTKTVFATIVSANLGKYNQSWFDYATTFIGSAVKQGY